MKTILSYSEVPQYKLILTFALFIVLIFSTDRSEKTDKQEEQKNSLIKENEKVNEAIMDKDWNALYDINDKYWREVKHRYEDDRSDFLRNHEEAIWVHWPVVQVVSYQIDTSRYNQDSICIKATTKNYFEAYHLFTFWNRNKDTMLHHFEYLNNKWYLREFGLSNAEPDTATRTLEQIDSVFYEN